MSKKKVLLRGVFINRDTNGEGVLKVGTTLIRVSTVMGILYNGYHKIIRQKIWYVSNKSKVEGELAMDGKSRVFRPEAEKIWHEDYQCEYYRGVIIDGEDNIVERCAKMHPNYTAAFSDAVEKMSVSPLYSRQTSPDMKKKLEEYKAKKALEKKRKTNVIFDPREWNEWKYIYDSCRGNLYRFRYLNQEETIIYP